MRGVGDPEAAEVMIVNTCGFINAAKQESIDALRELVEIKRADQMVIAAGCLSQRYGDTLVQEVPGLDGVIGTRRWMDIFDLIGRLRARKHPEPLYHLPGDAKVVGSDERGVLRASLQGRVRLFEDRGRLPAPLRLLCHSFNQGHGGQPTAGIDRSGSGALAGIGCQGSDVDRARQHRLWL